MGNCCSFGSSDLGQEVSQSLESLVPADPLVVGSFNIQNFGKKKFSDSSIVSKIVNIIRSHDVIVIQEVSDKKGTVVNDLLYEINGNKYEPFDFVLSPRTGQSSASEEQYAVFYKVSKVKVIFSMLYSGDGFTRQPFVVQLESTNCIFETFRLITAHTAPSKATKEIDSLHDVAMWAAQKLKNKNILIAGDLNASGIYFKTPEDNRLRGPQYKWLIEDHVDTTATDTLAAYDRIIAYGPLMESLIVPGSAKVLREGFDRSKVKVSDHFPVQVKVKVTNNDLEQFLKVVKSFIISVSVQIRIRLRRSENIFLFQDNRKQRLPRSNPQVKEWTSSSFEEAFKSLEQALESKTLLKVTRNKLLQLQPFDKVKVVIASNKGGTDVTLQAVDDSFSVL